MWTKVVNGINYNSSGGIQTSININGTTGGIITGGQNTIFKFIQLILNFSGYINNTAIDQFVDFAYPFHQQPTIGSNDTGLVISTTTLGITITSPNSITSYSGNIIIFGI